MYTYTYTYMHISIYTYIYIYTYVQTLETLFIHIYLSVYRHTQVQDDNRTFVRPSPIKEYFFEKCKRSCSHNICCFCPSTCTYSFCRKTGCERETSCVCREREMLCASHAVLRKVACRGIRRRVQYICCMHTKYLLHTYNTSAAYIEYNCCIVKLPFQKKPADSPRNGSHPLFYFAL